MTEPDATAMIGALTDPDALVVFAAIVVAISDTCRLAEMGYSHGGGISWVTPFGLQKRTALSREAIDSAAATLEQAGMLVAQPDHQHGYTSWRPNKPALTTAASRTKTPPTAECLPSTGS